MEKTILITGGAGYIGSITAECLIKDGYNVVVLDDLSTGHKIAVHPKAEFVMGNIQDNDCLNKLFESHSFYAVIHMAAKALIPESIVDPIPFYNSNVVGGIILINAMIRHCVKKIIFSSTAAVYGEPKYIPIDENHTINPMNPYGETKLIFEKLLKWYSNVYDMEAIVFRYFSAAGASKVYGENHVPETHLLPRIFEAALTNSEVKIFGHDYDTPDGTPIRDFINVLDIAKAHIKVLEKPYSQGFCVYNLGSGKGYSILQILNSIEDITHRKLKIKFVDRRSGDPSRLVASFEKAKKELNWSPSFKLQDIIKSAWRWHLSSSQHKYTYGRIG